LQSSRSMQARRLRSSQNHLEIRLDLRGDLMYQLLCIAKSEAKLA
jgi:hypothetical protein